MRCCLVLAARHSAREAHGTKSRQHRVANPVCELSIEESSQRLIGNGNGTIFVGAVFLSSQSEHPTLPKRVGSSPRPNIGRVIKPRHECVPTWSGLRRAARGGVPITILGLAEHQPRAICNLRPTSNARSGQRSRLPKFKMSRKEIISEGYGAKMAILAP